MEATELTPNISLEKDLKQYTGNAARVLNLLCSGVTDTEAALHVGVDLSYISQLKKEPDFQKQIVKKLQENQERALKIDENYVEMEKEATERLRTLLPLIHTPKDLMAVAKFANEAKKKTSSGIAGSNPNSELGQGNKAIKILMPTVVLNNFVVNPNNEIVAVGGRNLTTLNSASISALATDKQQEILEFSQAKQVTKIDRVANPNLIDINPNQIASMQDSKNRSKYHVTEEDLQQL